VVRVHRNSERGKRAILVDTFEEDYERIVAEARERAQAGTRGDVAEYLDVRAANDRLRRRGIEWLLDIFMAAAGELNRAGAGLQLARTEAHRFRVGTSTMVGTRLVLSRGVRSLTIEAGWPRAPRDGIVRRGGLACARITHFGSPTSDEDLLLLPAADGGEPCWFALGKTGAGTALLPEHVRLHFVKFLS
jgi:hypothetical protein